MGVNILQTGTGHIIHLLGKCDRQASRDEERKKSILQPWQREMLGKKKSLPPIFFSNHKRRRKDEGRAVGWARGKDGWEEGWWGRGAEVESRGW